MAREVAVGQLEEAAQGDEVDAPGLAGDGEDPTLGLAAAALATVPLGPPAVSSARALDTSDAAKAALHVAPSLAAVAAFAAAASIAREALWRDQRRVVERSGPSLRRACRPRPEEEEMRRVLAVVAGVLVAAAIGVQATDARPGGDDGGGKAILKFDTMAPVTGPFVGASHPVRGVSGGGLPWELDRAHGELRRDGRLDVRVDGLVLAHDPAVPANLQGTNPIPQFRAIVSCLTPDSPDTGETIVTDTFPASADGDARIRARIDLPQTCVAPVVFVTSPTNLWFAATGS